MKIDWNRKYTTISVYSFIVTCCIIVFYRIASDLSIFTDELSNIVATLQPFIIGSVIAYLLNFILKFYEERLFVKGKMSKLKGKSKRGLGILLTYVTTFIVLGLFMKFVVPQLVQSMVGLANDIPHYLATLTEIVDKFMNSLNINQEYLQVAVTQVNEFVNYILKIAADLIPLLGGAITDILSSVWNIVLGLIVSVYILIDKENFCALGRKIIFAIFNNKHANKALELVHRSNDTFGKFLIGKIIDSAIIGVLTFVLLTIFKMPYTLLISVIIGITNIIPFFGPFFGAIPSAIIILFVSPMKALIFLVLIFIIQQLDGNVIGPKILGDSIGISAFWILFSLLVAAKFMGLVGMIIGVPVFAIVYSIIKEIVEAKLADKGLPTETKDYMSK